MTHWNIYAVKFSLFNPDISEGPWQWVGDPACSDGPMPKLMSIKNNENRNIKYAPTWILDLGNSESYYPTAGEPPEEEDAMAIAAVPELLDVYKQAKNLMDNIRSGMPVYPFELDDAIDKLHKRHCIG